MKKKCFALIIILLIAFNLSACGDSGSSDRGSQSEETSDPASDDGAGDDNINSGAEKIQTLTDWYNSEERSQLETTFVDVAEAMGMTFYITVQEPDILIYNYRYIEQIDFQGAAQEQIDAVYAESMQPYIGTITPIPAAFRESYGIPLRIVRLAYFNADGSLITVMDITEDYQSPDVSGDSPSTVVYENLQDWLASGEASQIAADTNRNLASAGMTFKLSAEENILVYEYYISDALGFDSLTEEELSNHLGGVVESQREAMLSLFDLFQSQYGLSLDAIRIVFFSEDGSKTLYTSDIA